MKAKRPFLRKNLVVGSFLITDDITVRLFCTQTAKVKYSKKNFRSKNFRSANIYQNCNHYKFQINTVR